VIAGVMTPIHRGGVVVRLIDPALLEPHCLMPPFTRRRDDRQPNPRPA
jgi:hypothetical protein